MKKICVVMALLLAAVAAGAQTMYDAMQFSSNNYAGTARSMAVGNALTAVGGDLGAIPLNPAGSAVFNYSEIAFTPGVAISSVSSQYSSFGENKYGSASTIGSTRFNVPNAGVVFSVRTGNSSGVKGWAFSFISSQTQNYLSFAKASGANSLTSAAAEKAGAAWGIAESTLDNYSSFNNSDCSWDILSAYQSGQIASIFDGYYVGSNEAVAQDNAGDYYNYVAGDLRQTSSVKSYGTKDDIVMNAAVNVDDRVYIGGTLGIPVARYRYSESFTEAAVNPEEFPVDFYDSNNNEVRTYYKSSNTGYNYAANYDGIYAKIGVIALLTDNLRVGAAFQTPTALTVTETWVNSASCSFDNSSFSGSVSSPTGEYTYGLRTPYIANFGLAYTLGTSGFISLDYEMADYSVMRFRTRYADGISSYDTDDYFSQLNDVNRNFCGVSSSLRIGAEFKLNPMFALRAGYNLTTSPEQYWVNNYGYDVYADDYLADYDAYQSGLATLDTKYKVNSKTSSISFGLGYSSPGSFFADIAARKTTYPSSVFAPYYDYDGFASDGEYYFMEAPRIKSNSSLWYVSLTFGWRF